MASDILIIDDDRALCTACVRHLEQLGYACRQAHDGQSALASIRKAPPALVVLDLLLPKKDGRALLAELRRAPQTAKVPVLVISGMFKDSRTLKECREAGACGFLEKPFEMARLAGEIQTALGRAPTPTQAPGQMRVPLSDVPVSEYLWRTMSGGFSGAVHFERDRLHKILLVRDGVPRAIRSNSMRETLGVRLVQAGRITKRQHEDALRHAKHDERRQGEKLVETGLLTPQALERCLDEQVEEKLLETFRWPGGAAWVQSGVTELKYASDVVDWSPEELILCGSLQMPVDRVLSVMNTFADFTLSVARASLPPRADRLVPLVAALSAAGRASRVRPLLAEHGPALYGLWLSGIVQLAPAGASAAVPEPHQRGAVRAGEDLGALLSRWREKNLYEVLEVELAASREQIQAAYIHLARKYHPDRFTRQPEPVREAANQIFALLSTARDTLSDPDARAAYDRKLEGENPDDDRVKLQRILRAERLFQEGEALMRKRDMPGALERLTEAIKLNPDEGEFHALFAWADFVTNRDQNERAETLAIERLQKAAQLAPGSPKGYYYLGLLHKACGRSEPAIRAFQKALQIEPQHAEAQSEIRLLQLRRVKDKEPKTLTGGGLFGFGRKKG